MTKQARSRHPTPTGAGPPASERLGGSPHPLGLQPTLGHLRGDEAAMRAPSRGAHQRVQQNRVQSLAPVRMSIKYMADSGSPAPAERAILRP